MEQVVPSPNKDALFDFGRCSFEEAFSGLCLISQIIKEDITIEIFTLFRTLLGLVMRNWGRHANLD